MDTQKTGLDREMIIGYGVISFVAATAIIFFGMFFFNVDARSCNTGALVAVYSTLSGVIWGVLLCRNC